MEYIFPAPEIPSVATANNGALFPVHRIYCVGRNYAAHAREMGADEREPPFFFAKPADAIVPDGATIPYPPATKNFHHEIELVVAIGKAGVDIPVESALDHVYGYAVGVDLTRRDLQLAARDKGRPWDMGKGFDNAAPCAPIHAASEVGHFDRGTIWIKVNGETRQNSDLDKLIWNVSEVIAHLSGLVRLTAGDLIYTGTPAGVGPIVTGDQVHGYIDRLGDLRFTVS